MEQILSIKKSVEGPIIEFQFLNEKEKRMYRTITEPINKSYPEYVGYCIKTEQNEYYVLVSDEWQCCEYCDINIFSEVNLLPCGCYGDPYPKLLNVKIGEILELASKDDKNTNYVDVTFETDGGNIVFRCFNQHNGYYGHGVIILKNHEELFAGML